MQNISPFKDLRKTTYESRVRIGFLPDYKMWRDAPATFSKHCLAINNHPVMEDWEKDYMQELARIACRKKGQILEVGFGMGISARFVQSHPIAAHTIIEANKDVFQELLAFAAQAPKPVRPILGFWQDETKSLPAASFSGILFDTYPLTAQEVHANHFSFFTEAFRLLRRGGVLTYYSDEISDFSALHRKKLFEAGFTKLQKKICRVNPPSSCAYWKSKTIIAPIITK